MSSTSADVIVAGLGPTGLTAALALARLGLRVAAVGRPLETARDARAMALMGPSITFLENMRVWRDCAAYAQPLTAIRIIDATGRLLRAPETEFTAADVGRDSFGACITTADLVRVLLAQARTAPTIAFVETAAIAGITTSAADVTVATAEGARIVAPLLVGADGRASPSRRAAGIAIDEQTYPQTALAVTFEHARPHNGVSIEFHRPDGPLTSVPLRTLDGVHRSSLVWVERHERAGQLMRLDAGDFARTLRHELQGVLGAISAVSARSAFPLSFLRARSMARARVALVGEAAHVIPPIGAQGLNLGLRDVAGLAGVIAHAQRRSSEPSLASTLPDLGSPELLASYDRGRSMDVRSRLTAVDLLNRSLLSAQLPVQVLRTLGLHVLASFAPVRRALIHQGLATNNSLPELMAPDHEIAAASAVPH